MVDCERLLAEYQAAGLPIEAVNEDGPVWSEVPDVVQLDAAAAVLAAHVPFVCSILPAMRLAFVGEEVSFDVSADPALETVEVSVAGSVEVISLVSGQGVVRVTPQAGTGGLIISIAGVEGTCLENCLALVFVAG